MDKLRELMQKDWFIRIMALCIAVFLWVYAESEQNPIVTKTFDIPVQVLNLADDYVVAGGGKNVAVRVQGKSNDLISMRSEDLFAYVDLTAANIGTESYDVKVNVPTAVERFTVSPNTLMLTVDQLKSATLPIHVNTNGTPATGYLLESVEVIPDTASLYGKSQVLKNLTEMQTETIDISGMTEETVLEAKLKEVDGVLISGGSTVVVRFHIVEEQGTATYTADIQLQNIPVGMEALPSQQTGTVLLRGGSLLLNNPEEKKKIQLYVDCSGMKAGENILPLQVHYEGNLEVIQINPGNVTVNGIQEEIHDMPGDNPEIQQGESEADENHEDTSDARTDLEGETE